MSQTRHSEAAFEVVVLFGLENHVEQCKWSQPTDTKTHTQALGSTCFMRVPGM